MVPDWTAQKSEGGTLEQQGFPLLAPHPMEADILTVMAPMHVNMSDTQWVYLCWVMGCSEGPLSSLTAICTHMGTKLMCPFCPVIFY